MVYHCAQLWYTTQHKTVMIIFPVIFQTIIIAQTMSTWGERACMQLTHTTNITHNLERRESWTMRWTWHGSSVAVVIRRLTTDYQLSMVSSRLNSKFEKNSTNMHQTPVLPWSHGTRQKLLPQTRSGNIKGPMPSEKFNPRNQYSTTPEAMLRNFEQFEMSITSCKLRLQRIVKC